MYILKNSIIELNIKMIFIYKKKVINRKYLKNLVKISNKPINDLRMDSQINLSLIKITKNLQYKINLLLAKNLHQVLKKDLQKIKAMLQKKNLKMD